MLVVWEMGEAAGTKSFFPRMGSGICTVNTSDTDLSDASSLVASHSSLGLMNGGTKVVLTTADNCLRLLSIASMGEDWSIRGLCLTSRADTIFKRQSRITPSVAAAASNPSSNIATPSSALGVVNHEKKTVNRYPVYSMLQSDLAWTCKIVVEPRTGYLVCNGYPGQLQACDAATGSFRHAHQIINYTKISKKEVYSKLYVPSIVHYKFISSKTIGTSYFSVSNEMTWKTMLITLLFVIFLHQAIS